MRPGIFVSRTREKLGRTLEPCTSGSYKEKAKFVKHHISLCFCQLRLLHLWEVYSYNYIIVLCTLKSWHSYLEREWALSEYFSLTYWWFPAKVQLKSCVAPVDTALEQVKSGRAPTEVINLGTSIRPQLFVSEKQFPLSSLEKLWRLFNTSWHDGTKSQTKMWGLYGTPSHPIQKHVKCECTVFCL